MITVLDNGLKLLSGSDGLKSLLFDSNLADICIKYAQEYNIKRVIVSSIYGYESDNLKQILPLSNWVNELIIPDKNINYTGLEKFNELTLLSFVDNQQNIVDLTNFPSLITLNCNFTDRVKGLENAQSLKKLTISDYKPNTKDLSDFPNLKNVEYLSLINTNIHTLQGVSSFSGLKALELFSASKLQTIQDLRVLSATLEQVEIEKCKKIYDLYILGKVTSLKKIILTESGSIESLAFVKELPHLEFLSFWGTNILDGNMEHCKGLKYVSFDNKKHYTHKAEMLK